MRILVIDDDPEVLQVLGTFFEGQGHTPTLCSDADDGMKKFVTLVPDLVLLDIVLPKKDGIQLLKEMKDLDKNATIVMITAYKDANKVIDAFRQGAADCLLKPFNFDHIVNDVLPRVKIRS